MSFKLIAIRPLIGTKLKYIKNLTAGEVYNLCNDYSLLNEHRKPVSYEESVHSIIYNKTVPESLYSIKKPNGDIVNINISAIVGKNGAGKSSLIDLLLHSIFIVSDNLGYVVPENFIESDSNYGKSEMSNFRKELRDMSSGVKVELYYLLNNKCYRLTIINLKFKLESCLINNKRGTFSNERISIKNFSELNNFFYTIVVNYSLYSYNSDYTGIWLRSFFHKNDGYQMPIVINPFRNNGNIDINSETLLTRSRLLSNILSISNYKKINYKSEIEKIELFLDHDKNYKLLSNRKPRFTPSYIKKFRELVLSPLFFKMYGSSIQYPAINTSIKRYAEIYLINKLITIPSKYDSFKEFDNRFAKFKERSDNYSLTKRITSSYVDELYKDRSHITLKVRQTLNFLREDIFNISSEILNSKNSFDLNHVIKKINDVQKNDWFTELIDYLPPPFLYSRIKFKDGSYFEDLSSGEKQKIYSLNSIIYHLRNLDSINKNKIRNVEKHITSYQSINLIFDEVELYYHPQYQKETINSLLNLIKISNFKFINNINIIFLTHSPFILSDIPIQNTTLLTIDKKTGKSKLVKRKKQSFGANIHDLLADNFFLTGALIGNFADIKIINLIKKIKDGKTSVDDKFLLKLIGDTFLKSSIEKYKEIINDQDSNR